MLEKGGEKLLDLWRKIYHNNSCIKYFGGLCVGKIITKILAALSSAVIMLGLLWAGSCLLHKEFVFWNGSLLRRESSVLDIKGKQMRDLECFLEFPDLAQLDARDTGMTPQQFEWFRQELPGCQVLWDIPIQGAYYAQETRELTVEQLTQEEIHLLQYFPELTAIDVGDWGDYPRIRELRETYPRCRIHYRVQIGGEWWDDSSVSMVLQNADPVELGEKLDLFPNLESVMLTGTVPSRQMLSELQEQYPEVFFLWKMDVLGMTLETDIPSLDLSGIRLETVEELEALLPYFPVLEQVELGEYGMPAAELAAVVSRYPQIRFLFDLTIGSHTLRTDAPEIDISNTPLESVAQIEELLPCFPNLEKVVMCECGISNEDMDDLNRRYEDIRFVWSVDLGGMLFRTDAIHFTPNRWGLKLTNEDVYPLRYCVDMICVDIGHQLAVTNCDWAAFMPELKYLILAETGISDLTPLTGLEKLIYLELFLSPVLDYSPLTTLKALEDLNLCYTRGDPTPIGEMTWLKRLWWTGMWQASVMLPEKLGENTYMEFLSPSSTGKGWREGQNYYDMRDLIGMNYMTG